MDSESLLRIKRLHHAFTESFDALVAKIEYCLDEGIKSSTSKQSMAAAKTLEALAKELRTLDSQNAKRGQKAGSPVVDILTTNKAIESFSLDNFPLDLPNVTELDFRPCAYFTISDAYLHHARGMLWDVPEEVLFLTSPAAPFEICVYARFRRTGILGWEPLSSTSFVGLLVTEVLTKG